MNPADLPAFGCTLDGDGAHFTVWGGEADALTLCLFDGDRETDRLVMDDGGEGIFRLTVPGLEAGARYGLRTEGRYDPAAGYWYDPAKLLLDPWAVQIDRRFEYDPRLALPRAVAVDTATLMPKGVVSRQASEVTPRPPCFRQSGLIYELQVRGFSLLHPDVPQDQRGTIAALRHPAIIDHLLKLGVSAVELMPINAWIDERHLGPLGLSNSWGYNPVSYFALDPRLAPGGIAELRDVVTALHDVGIGVLMDVVYNHDGESDALGPTLSLRGLDARRYFRHREDGSLINDTGTGNALNCAEPIVRRLVLDSLRYFVRHAGIDGFRFDLAPALGRLPDGFCPEAPLLAEMRADPILADRILIAEPWDIGPGGYQLGRFGSGWVEWNDRYRDDVRRFWRGDLHMSGALATRLAGSSDIFGEMPTTGSVNFIAAHDGFTLADLVAHEQRHNDTNGEQNRDGHGENFSWNNGVEGATSDPDILAARRADIIALLSTLFLTRGPIMLTAGDEFGRSQRGNNNAYCQDNEISWIDWEERDRAIESASFALGAQRRAIKLLNGTEWLTDADVAWLRPDGTPMTVADWESDGDTLCLCFHRDGAAAAFNRSHRPVIFDTPFGSGEVAARSVEIFWSVSAPDCASA